MQNHYKLPVMTLAQVYDCSAYGNGLYDRDACSNSEPNGSLADTGILLVAIVTIASMLMLAALLVRIWRRKPKRK